MNATTRILRSLLVLSLGGVVASCGKEAIAISPPVKGTQYIVGIDISGSRTAPELREAQVLLTRLVGERMSYGDRIVFIEMYGAADPQQFKDSIRALRGPEASPREKRELNDFRVRSQAIIPMFFDSTRKRLVKTTDVLGTLHRAADYSQSPGHDGSVLILLSDMIQATSELNMEREGAVPGAEWVQARAAEGRLPELRGVCVLVSGADTKSARGARIRKFWTEYFTQTGARFDARRYRGLIAEPAELRC